jgi:SAM-dependent methyltransferase
MSKLKDHIPKGFTHPSALPDSDSQAQQWQVENREWWEAHPMRYDWNEAIGSDEYTESFFDEIDRRFFEAAEVFFPPKDGKPFDRIIPYERIARCDVLEIGVGNGSHAALLARHARSFHGIDLTNYAVESTSRRFALFQLAGVIERMDAESLSFPDDSFDYIWTWGVIHHSSRIDRILREMHRVLRPRGQAAVMVYYRGWWNYYVVGSLLGLIDQGRVSKKILHEVAQKYTDGAIARYYSFPEWKRLAGNTFDVRRMRVVGNKAELLPIPAGRFKRALLRLLPDWIARFLLVSCRMGSMLVVEMDARSQPASPSV